MLTFGRPPPSPLFVNVVYGCPQWVLSAAHCFCEVTPCQHSESGIKIDFKPRDRVRLRVGVSDVNGDWDDKEDKHYEGMTCIPEEIILHPRYRLMPRPFLK